MRLRLFLVVAALLGGCAAAPAARDTTAAREGRATAGATGADAAPHAARDRELEERESRLRELESRLALRSAEVRELREELEERRERAREVVRIGAAAPARDPDGERALGAPELASDALEREPAAADDDEDDGAPRPVLRLYGAPRPAAIAEGVATFPGPQAPPIVPPPPRPDALGRLPVTSSPDVPAIPEQPIVVAGAPPPLLAAQPWAAARGASPEPPRAPEDDPIVREYQSALAHVEQRRFSEALDALARFAAAHPSHPYADNALFWQGEVLFAQREYRRAIALLDALVARYPDGNKVPDALLRIGTCYERLGDAPRARAYFRRVREQFPDSVAARMASREET